MTKQHAINRRQFLAAAGAGALAAGLRAAAPAAARDDHPPGLPDQHLGHADLLPAASRALLEKRGIKIEEFAVPSGNLTMQQMVARQVDMGTYAGPVVHPRPRQGRPRRHRA